MKSTYNRKRFVGFSNKQFEEYLQRKKKNREFYLLVEIGKFKKTIFDDKSDAYSEQLLLDEIKDYSIKNRKLSKLKKGKPLPLKHEQKRKVK